MKSLFYSLFICLFCSSVSVYAEGEIRDSITGVSFPSEVTFEYEGKEYRLQATGVATRKKLFVKVYSVASYLEQGSESKEEKIKQLLLDEKAKQLTIKWVRDVSAKQIQDGFQESFKNVLSGSSYAQLQGEIDKFIKIFSDVKKGDEHVFRWIPEGHIELMINGNDAGRFNNKEFAKGLWGIWLGDKSVVDRNNLISLIK